MRLFDEQDISRTGALVLRELWDLKGAEREALVPAMHDTYVEMRREAGTVASPAVDTFLGRQGPKAFDAVVIEPSGAPRAGVIFLHGFAGNFVLECWLVAKAARTIGAVTVCPSTDFFGYWWRPAGERTLRETLNYLQGRGIRKIFLAGLSNGGLGAAGAGARVRVRAARAGIVISGAPSAGEVAGLPTLVVEGELDPRMPVAVAHAFAARTWATYAGFDGGHFVLLTHREAVGEALSRWLRAHD